MAEHIYDHKDQWGDHLDVSRIPPETAHGPGVTFGVTPRHGGPESRRAVFLATEEAVVLLAKLAGVLGFRLTTEGGEPDA